MHAQSRGRAVEFFLIVAIGVVLLMILKRVNATNSLAVQYQRALETVSARLDEVSGQIAALAGTTTAETPQASDVRITAPRL